MSTYFDLGVYTSVSNPVWIDQSRQLISVDVVFAHLGDAPVKFNASSNDSVGYGVEIYNDIIAGKYGVIGETA